MNQSSPVVLRLKPKGKHRVLKGHPWVFSNQLIEIPAELEPGSEVLVLDGQGKAIGRGMGHPSTLITARIFERNPEAVLDDDWLEGYGEEEE